MSRSSYILSHKKGDRTLPRKQVAIAFQKSKIGAINQMTKTVLITRLDSSIFIYRDRIVVPRKNAITWANEDGSSKTDIAYTASIFDDENRDECGVQEVDECKTLEGLIRIAKLEIDLSIERYREWIG